MNSGWICACPRLVVWAVSERNRSETERSLQPLDKNPLRAPTIFCTLRSSLAPRSAHMLWYWLHLSCGIISTNNRYFFHLKFFFLSVTVLGYHGEDNNVSQGCKIKYDRLLVQCASFQFKQANSFWESKTNRMLVLKLSGPKHFQKCLKCNFHHANTDVVEIFMMHYKIGHYYCTNDLVRAHLQDQQHLCDWRRKWWALKHVLHRKLQQNNVSEA